MPLSDEVLTEIVTTEGPAFAATAVVVDTSSLLLTVMVCGDAVLLLVFERSLADTATAATPAPAAPPTIAPTARAPMRRPTGRLVRVAAVVAGAAGAAAYGAG